MTKKTMETDETSMGVKFGTVVFWTATILLSSVATTLSQETESVLVPAIIRLDGSTKGTLEEHNLHLGLVGTRGDIVSKAMVPQLFEVIAQSPSAGSRAQPGDSVDLVVKYFIDLPSKPEEAFSRYFDNMLKSGKFEHRISLLPEGTPEPQVTPRPPGTPRPGPQVIRHHLKVTPQVTPTPTPEPQVIPRPRPKPHPYGNDTEGHAG